MRITLRLDKRSCALRASDMSKVSFQRGFN